MVTKIKKNSKLLIFYGIFAVLTILYVLVACPNLNPLYADGATFWLVVITICFAIQVLHSFKLETFVNEKGQTDFKLGDKMKPSKWIIIVVATLWGLFIVINLIFTPLFFWKSYRNQLGDPQVKEFNTSITPIDTNQIPIVDKQLASALADKKLGEKPSLGSQVNLGEPTMQNVDGKLVWVVPLHHSGFFKWLANLSGSAGYIKVSATNLKDIEYIDTYKIKIQPNSYFFDDLTRQVRFDGGLFTGITDYSFELDDAGYPYWVVTTYKNTCGYNLPEANGVIIVDAQNGESKTYSNNEIPNWVDRVQPEDYIINQINNNGKYIKGIFNFSNSEKYMASKGENIVYNNGRCYLFTGITSVGSDESATGFYMVDMVTKESIIYRISGATEQSAMKSAQGAVQDLGYYATNPIILNVFDVPTYFMTLKDNENLIKKYAFVSVKDYMIVGVGGTMSEAKADYAKSLNDIGDKPIFGEDSNELSLSAVGVIDRISFTISDNNTVYSFTLDGKPGVIFSVPLSMSTKLPLTQKGDSINIKYIAVDDNNMSVREFNNLSF